MRPKPIVLIILDGWGYREDPQYNAIYAANTPNWDSYWSRYPHTLISGSGSDVGLPAGQMGNSEVGHLHMGAGRLVPQDLMRVDLAIENGQFFENEVIVKALSRLKKSQAKLHILGLLSPGGVHSHERHLLAMVQLAAEHKLPHVYVHGILDGRDTPPRSALSSIAKLEKQFKELNTGHFASIIGRYYAMDRDQRWDRVEKAYNLYTLGEAPFQAVSAAEALELAYERNESDEFVKGTSIHADGTPPITFDKDDVVIFMNFRADRARQLTRALTSPSFSSFERKKIPALGGLVTLTRYASDIEVAVAFPPIHVTNSFGEYIAQKGLSQLRIAETEKYAHVTFFFNGGREAPFIGEDRILVPSPKVATYDLKPEMSARELTAQLVADIKLQSHDVIICNFANPDMVGHSGDMTATIKAVEVIDECLGKIVAALEEVGGEVIITSDHGNAELMYDVTTTQLHTAHTENLVPFLYIGREAEVIRPEGSLIDIAPTLLYLLNLPQPSEMHGNILLQLKN
ncbi:MAG: 2,3-bisphosphoglycerate-independent phosphoglycerate mutase [Gammaproteobacteria bacterium]|nr:2,3-bisphosphoglycerate-independent phosphoglycerate mutase [Gammaproteobacteria bacterium]